MKSAEENRFIRKILKPLGFIYILFTYALGVSAAHYLGAKIDIFNAITGLMICLLIKAMRDFLGAYYDHPESYHSTLTINDPQRKELLSIRRPLLLQYTLLILTAGATLTTILIVRSAFSPSALLLLGVALIIYFFSVAPPLQFSNRGYGELVEALFIANLVPAIAYSITGSDISFLIIELTLPVTFIYLAMKIALSLKSLEFDLNHGRTSMSIKAGWQNAMLMHNLFILLAFLLAGLFLLFGLPWSLTWPLFLAAPVGGLQIIQLIAISRGAKPNWKTVQLLSVGLFLLFVYLEITALWI